MKLLLDTHVVLWLLGASERISKTTTKAIMDSDNEVFVSVVSLWEITLKVTIGKLIADVALIESNLEPNSLLRRLPISPSHLVTLQTLIRVEGHNDPFDHLLIAQARSEKMTFVSADGWVDHYPIKVLRP